MGMSDPKILEDPVCRPGPFGPILKYDHSGRIFCCPAAADSNAEFVR